MKISHEKLRPVGVEPEGMALKPSALRSCHVDIFFANSTQIFDIFLNKEKTGKKMLRAYPKENKKNWTFIMI